MATMNVSLPDAMKARVERRAEVERYGSANDIRDLIREEALALVQAAITEGIESGATQSFDAEAFKLRMRERHVVR